MNTRNIIIAVGILLAFNVTFASDEGHKVEREYEVFPAAPRTQTKAQMNAKSEGCISCHTNTDELTMHETPAIKLGCTDCHGGNAEVHVAKGARKGEEDYQHTLEKAHVLPLFPDKWHFPSSANPERTYTLLNKESPEFIRFVNPSDYRIAREACGACHLKTIQAAESSIMATTAMLWGGASYNNGILPYKQYLLGEAYNKEGEGVKLLAPIEPTQEMLDRSIMPAIYPLPAWETIKPGDVFRVFEGGGRNISNLFPEIGLPNSLGQLQRIEKPGKPDLKQSNRGPGTGGRVSIPVLNITKTRLNDPHTWFMGTNDQPGDYRSSGCASCHVVYANDRDPRHSGKYAKFGHTGKTQTKDDTISKDETGHPLQHKFTRAIPTSQCMSCHMHQPNMFMNTYLGYTMWDYESDAPFMWPEKQFYPTEEEKRHTLDRNPEGASPRGKWKDMDFVLGVSELNDQLNDTQFADYHGHGWNFRAVFKRDRDGNLLDKDGAEVSDKDPKKFKKAVHLSSIHVDAGMHCVDCHYGQDSHGNGHLYGEVAAAVEISCVDCHGTPDAYPNLYTSGPAALDGGMDLSAIRNPDGKKRFEWIGDDLIQRSVMDPELEWKVSLIKDAVDPKSQHYNAKAAKAKTMSRKTDTKEWGDEVAKEDWAHSYDNMECYACHTSWTTSCGGCHLPIEANAKTERHHYEGGASRNFATYNPQVARDQMFLIGKRETAKGGKFAPVRSTSALVLSSTNANREKIYMQQPPVAASGFSSQAFNPHFPHTTRKTETKTCNDCHLSESNDNNAIMAQLLMYGTKFVDFIGHYAWVGGEGHITGVEVTEWEEPQAVIGSYLQRYAYPDFFNNHQEKGQVLEEGYAHNTGPVNCLQLRGEYLYVAEGKKGVQVYDVASIANKGFSQRIITAPVSPLGHDAHIKTTNATCLVLPTNQPIHPDRNKGDLMRIKNQEQPFHPIYNYAVVTDSSEGLILFDTNTFSDGNPLNNNISRAVTWNPNGLLNGAKYMVLGGYYAYIVTDRSLVVVNLNEPTKPVHVKTITMNKPQAVQQQFRYLFVTDADGLKTIDVTNPEQPILVANNTIKMNSARKLHLARTFAYVANGKDGIGIVDIKNPEKMTLLKNYNADGKIVDAHDVTVATTNASLFAYVADGSGGLKIVQLTSPTLQPKFYGFSPEPNPLLIASYPTKSPAYALSRGLERDRGVDETGGQVAVFGRRGSRPLNLEEMRRMYLDENGKPWFVED